MIEKQREEIELLKAQQNSCGQIDVNRVFKAHPDCMTPPKEQSPQRAREFDWEIWIDEDEAYIQNVDLATNCHLVKVIEYSSYLALRTELEITTQNAMLAGKLADDRIGELESELLDHKAGISHDLFEMVCNERDASDIRIKELEQENEKLKEALKSASHTPHKKGYCTICDALGVSTNE